jgi:hypothetical protein
MPPGPVNPLPLKGSKKFSVKKNIENKTLNAIQVALSVLYYLPIVYCLLRLPL